MLCLKTLLVFHAVARREMRMCNVTKQQVFDGGGGGGGERQNVFFYDRLLNKFAFAAE